MSENDANLGLELIGHDAKGDAIAIPVADGVEAAEAESRVRAAGGRIVRAKRRPHGAVPTGVSAQDFARFNEMLASAIQRGAPLPDGLRDLARDLARARFKESIRAVASALERGEPVEQAFATESAGFPPLYGRLLTAGAAAGKLPEVLLSVSRGIRAHLVYRRGVMEACVYPLVLFLACNVLLAGFALVILPIYESVGDQVHMKMPALTRWLTLHAPMARWVFWTLVGGGAAFAVWWTTPPGRSEGGRVFKEWLLRHIPLTKHLYEAALWSNVADMLGQLFANGVPAGDALRLVGAATGSPWASGLLDRLAVGAESGRPAPSGWPSCAAIFPAPWPISRPTTAGPRIAAPGP